MVYSETNEFIYKKVFAVKEGNKMINNINNIPMLDRMTSDKDSYKKEEYYKGYKIPIISDTMFKTMINNTDRKQYASLLISIVLNKDYKEIYDNIEFIKGTLDKEREIEKGREVDFICKVDNEYVGIEMNNNFSKSSLERNISYCMDIYKSNLRRGESYSFNHVLQININNFFFKGNDQGEEEYSLKNNKGELLTDKIKIFNIYLPLIRKKYYNGEELSDLEKLMLVFNEEDNEKLSKVYEGESIMEEYVKDAKRASMEDDIVGLYDKELHEEKLRITELEEAREKGIEIGTKRGMDSGIKQGMAAGIAQGKKESILETAKNMLKKKLDINLIAECTGLSEEEINNLD